MNRNTLTALAISGSIAAASLSTAQSSSQGLGLGVTGGIYFPSTARVRDAFGSQLFNYGLGGTGTSRPSNGSLTPDLNLLTGNANGNKLFVGTFTYGYEYNLNGTSKQLVPYVRPFIGLSYFDFGITEGAHRDSLKRLGDTYGLEIGAVISQRIRVGARYNVYSSEESFLFNGFTIFVSYAFL